MARSTKDDLTPALEALEKYLGDTGSGIAKTLGVTPQAYYSLKRGKGVTLNSIEKIEKMFGVRLFVLNPELVKAATSQVEGDGE